MIEKRDVFNFAKIRWLDEFMTGHKGFIAGGCFKNIFNAEKVKDLDVFFESEQDFAAADSYYSSRPELWYLYYENKKVKAYRQLGEYRKPITVELIRNVYGTAEEILNMFDFTITKFAYYKEIVQDEEGDHTEYKVLCHDRFFEHLQLKRLVVDDKLPFPVSTFERMLRYAKYGYFPCKETKLRIIAGIREVEGVDGLSESLYDGLD